MKIIFLSIIILALASTVYSQDSKQNQIDLSGYFFNNIVFRFNELEGSGWIEDGHGERFGIEYSSHIKKNFWFNTGIEVLRAEYTFHGAISGLPEPPAYREHSLTLIQIPIRFRYDLLQFFYIKSGISLDIQAAKNERMDVDNQSGIGFSLIAGANVNVFKSFYISLEPEFGITSLLPFIGDDNQQHFQLSGIGINLGYRF